MPIASPYFIPDSALMLDGAGKGRDYALRIRDLPDLGKPRERLIHDGPASLSVRELLAVVLTTGTAKEDVLELTGRIARGYGERGILAETDPSRLSADLDVPIVKACQIVAVGELGRRFYEKNPAGFSVIRNARDVYEYLADMRSLSKEQLRGLYLNSRNRVIHDEVISIGTVNSNLVHPREVFRPAIEYSAAAVILAHNHPSGESEPSEEDRRVTEQIIAAGKLVGISVLDHVVISKDGWSSIKADY